MVMTNSTYDGLCYNVDAIKQSLGDAVEVLHFDEAWYAYANFHEFYDGYHAISSAPPARSPHAITFATHSTHKLLAALSQASMIHVQHSETQPLDMARFNEAFMMHTSTSPQYGIIASCDVAAAMMEQPAGRALVQETIDEALGFRRAMTVGQGPARRTHGGSMSGSPTRWLETESADKTDWLLKPGDKWHGFEGLAANHVRVDPIKVTILTPGLSADGTMQEIGIPAGGSRQVPVSRAASRSRRPGSIRSWCCSRWGSPRANGARWSPSSSTSRISTTPMRRSTARMPALAEAHPEAYARWA